MLDHPIPSSQSHAHSVCYPRLPRLAFHHVKPMPSEWRSPYFDTRGKANLVVENHLVYLQLLSRDLMGCRQSRPEDAEDDSVESIRYSRRSTKMKRSKRKKLSKTKSETSEKRADNEAEEIGLESVHIPSTPETGKSSKDKESKRKAKKNKEQMFSSQQRINNVLSLSVDTPEAAQMEAKQGKLGSKHVFPIWESHYNETCKCANEADSEPSNTSDKDSRKSNLSSDRLCKRCSRLLVNSKRGVSNNNNSSSVAASSTEANGIAQTVNTESSVVAGEGSDYHRPPVDPNNLTNDPLNNPTNDPLNSLTGDPFQKLSQQAAITNLLVMAAFNLSVPATNLLFKNRKNAWIQLAGHPGSFAPAGPKTIWKKRLVKENNETLAYQALSEFPQSKYIMPTFHREVEFNGEYFIEIEDLLHHFNDPSIMDIKMGTRTFLEAEVKNPVLRKDLYEKMVKVEPNAPTAAEQAQQAITKLRYMQFREHESSTASLGFRIEAIRMSGEPPNTNLKKVRTKEEVSYFIETFVKGHEVVIPLLHQRLCDIRDKFESIPFFQKHEIIGSSLLIMFDSSNHAGVWMIDFAKTIPVDNILTHRDAWQQGNHEDGYLTGLDNLVEIFGALSLKQQENTEESNNVS